MNFPCVQRTDCFLSCYSRPQMCQPPAARDEESHQCLADGKATRSAHQHSGLPVRSLRMIHITAAFLICWSVIACSINAIPTPQTAIPDVQLRLKRCIPFSTSEMLEALASGLTTSRRATRASLVYSPPNSPLPELIDRVSWPRQFLQCSPKSDLQGEAHDDPFQTYTRLLY